MTRFTLILTGQTVREKAVSWCRRLPVNTRVTFVETKRSLPQNDRMWAMLSDISLQTTHHGLKLQPDDWKLLFLDALKREVRMVPSLSGNGIVSLGRSSSDLSKAEFGDLFLIMEEFGARNGVVFSEPVSSAARAPAQLNAKSVAGEAVDA